jgi:transcription elongation factor Elf1
MAASKKQLDEMEKTVEIITKNIEMEIYRIVKTTIDSRKTGYVLDRVFHCPLCSDDHKMTFKHSVDITQKKSNPNRKNISRIEKEIAISIVIDINNLCDELKFGDITRKSLMDTTKILDDEKIKDIEKLGYTVSEIHETSHSIYGYSNQTKEANNYYIDIVLTKVYEV